MRFKFYVKNGLWIINTGRLDIRRNKSYRWLCLYWLEKNFIGDIYWFEILRDGSIYYKLPFMKDGKVCRWNSR